MRRNAVSVYIIHDFQEKTFFDAKVTIILMGYLHPFMPTDMDDASLIEEVELDTMTSLASLSRPNWGPQEALVR